MTVDTLCQMLPRLFELHNLALERAVGHHYFERFAQDLGLGGARLRAYQVHERRLAALDDSAWADLQPRVMRRMVHHARAAGGSRCSTCSAKTCRPQAMDDASGVRSRPYGHIGPSAKRAAMASLDPTPPAETQAPAAPPTLVTGPVTVQ